MLPFPFILARISDLSFLVPLIVAVSIVYSASRHESMGVIFWHALRVGVWMAGFMAVVLGLLALLAWQL
jgi:hypothetical protein